MRVGRTVGWVVHLGVVLVGVTLLVSSLMYLTPGDPVELMLGAGGHVSPEARERLRADLGLDRPWWEQMGSYIGGAARGDLGRSYRYGRPVTAVLGGRLPATLELTFLSLLLALVTAIPLGSVMAARHQGLTDRMGTVGTLVGISMPGFWLGIVLLIVFAVRLHLLPTGGRLSDEVGLRSITGFHLLDGVMTGNWAAVGDALRHLALPTVTLAAPMTAVVTRMVRSSMLEVIRQDYILFARAKGLPESVVLVKHALRNALIPTVSIVAVHTGLLLSGNMIVETVFSWNGVGRLAVQAIEARDYPLVQGTVLLYAFTYVVLNSFADFLYTRLNPRAREERRQR